MDARTKAKVDEVRALMRSLEVGIEHLALADIVDELNEVYDEEGEEGDDPVFTAADVDIDDTRNYLEGLHEAIAAIQE